MLGKSEGQLAEDAQQRFALTAASSLEEWSIAADWLEEQAPDAFSSVLAAAFRSGIWTPTIESGSGDGSGSG